MGCIYQDFHFGALSTVLPALWSWMRAISDFGLIQAAGAVHPAQVHLGQRPEQQA